MEACVAVCRGSEVLGPAVAVASFVDSRSTLHLVAYEQDAVLVRDAAEAEALNLGSHARSGVLCSCALPGAVVRDTTPEEKLVLLRTGPAEPAAVHHSFAVVPQDCFGAALLFYHATEQHKAEHMQQLLSAQLQPTASSSDCDTPRAKPVRLSVVEAAAKTHEEEDEEGLWPFTAENVARCLGAVAAQPPGQDIEAQAAASAAEVARVPYEQQRVADGLDTLLALRLHGKADEHSAIGGRAAFVGLAQLAGKKEDPEAYAEVLLMLTRYRLLVFNCGAHPTLADEVHLWQLSKVVVHHDTSTVCHTHSQPTTEHHPTSTMLSHRWSWCSTTCCRVPARCWLWRCRRRACLCTRWARRLRG